MKKTLLSAAAFAVVAVSAVAVAPTTSEAIPAFARQTGAACLSCHFQTFPALTAFGRSFKMGSFTDVGEEALVEDDNLSIPATLNATVVIRGDYTNTKVTGATGSGAWNIPSETPILIAGRVGSNSGAFVEFANGGAGAGVGSAGAPVSVGNWQFLNSWDMGGFKVGLSAHNSTFGGSAAMEYSNVFGQHSGKNNGGFISAIQNIGFSNPTLEIGAWAGNEMGNLQIGLIAPSAAQGANVGFKLGTLVRGALTTDVAGWDTLVGFGVVSGKAGKTATGLGAPIPMGLWFIDAQAQGEIGDTSIGVYADYASANGKTDATSGTANFYKFAAGTGAAGEKNTGWSIRADVKPLHNLGLGAGYGQMTTKVGGVSTKQKLWQIGGFYEIYQNFEINVFYNEDKTGAVKTNATTVEFEALM